MPTTAKIKALSKTDTTGITPPLAHALYEKLGTAQVAIVEFESVDRTENQEGDQSVGLRIISVEPSPVSDKDSAELLRELARAFYFQRNPQPALTTGDPSEREVQAILATGTALTHCPECNLKYTQKDLAHTRGAKDGFPPCTYKRCGHIVQLDSKTCKRDHPTPDAEYRKAAETARKSRGPAPVHQIDQETGTVVLPSDHDPADLPPKSLSDEELLVEATKLVVTGGKVSGNVLEKGLNIGRAKSAALLSDLGTYGIVAADGGEGLTVLFKAPDLDAALAKLSD